MFSDTARVPAGVAEYSGELDTAVVQFLDDSYRAALARWPGITTKPQEFRDFIVTKAMQGAAESSSFDLLGALTSLCCEDLVLVHGCLSSCDVAIACFEQQFRPLFHKVLGRIRSDKRPKEDRYHSLLVSLLGTSGKLRMYNGQGSLTSWLRVVITRELLDSARAEARDTVEAVDNFDTVAGLQADPALQCLKQEYRDSFTVAFRHAVAGLTSRQRFLLRENLVQRVSVDRLSGIYNVHRATVARWIAEARETVITAVAAQLRDEFGVLDSEVQSVFRLVESGVDFNMSSVFEGLPASPAAS